MLTLLQVLERARSPTGLLTVQCLGVCLRASLFARGIEGSPQKGFELVPFFFGQL